MSEWMNLLEETNGHFQEGALSVRAYTDEATYIITKEENGGGFMVTVEEPGFPKRKAKSLDDLYRKVFGIEARY